MSDIHDRAALPHPGCPFNRALIENQFGQILTDLKEVLELARKTNGRVTGLELREAVHSARAEEREHAALEAAKAAEGAAKRQATLVSTLISLAGLALGAVGMWFGR